MDQSTTVPQEPRKNRSNTVLLALVVLLLISNVVLLYLWSQKGDEAQQFQQQVTAVSSEKENVTKLLEDMLAQYDTLSTSNEKLTAEMSAQKAQIEDLVQKVKNGTYSLEKAKKEAATLRKIMQGYVVTIDSLNQVNQALTAENLTTKQELGEVKGQKAALENMTAEQAARLAKGAVLTANVMTAEALFLRNSGKQVQTERASKAEMIKCSFTLGENRTADPGNKVLYMRVISPDGSVLPANEPDNRFKFNGMEGDFSVKREVNYQNQPIDVAIFWTAPGEMASGQYIVEVYESGGSVGKTTFTLK
jgi:ABC-type transporter Mla subunit MlaD